MFMPGRDACNGGSGPITRSNQSLIDREPRPGHNLLEDCYEHSNW